MTVTVTNARILLGKPTKRFRVPASIHVAAYEAAHTRTHNFGTMNKRGDADFRSTFTLQTKILESWTNLSECIFEAIFKGVSTGFGLQNVEYCFENAFWKVRPTFQNLRLGSITWPPTNEDVRRMNKRWNATFFMQFSRAGVLCLGKEPLNRQWKIRISSFVHPSKIFVWCA